MSKIASLRAHLKSLNLDGFILPHGDPYRSEYVAPAFARLEWLTGFSGSFGEAVILKDQAVLFVDGRYTIQAKKQAKEFSILHHGDNPPMEWIARQAGEGARIGYDPWLHTRAGLDRYKKALQEKNIALVALEKNPVDSLWQDRPLPPVSPLAPQDLKYAGQNSTEKRAMLATQIKKRGVKAVLLTQTDSIAWLLNMRGGDVEFNPIALCYALLHHDETVDLYIDPRKITPAIKKHFGNAVAVYPEADLPRNLAAFKGKKIQIDPQNAPAKIPDHLRQAGADIVLADDPCLLPKACKNKAEQKGMREAHIRDGVAYAKFLHWLADQDVSKLNEISTAEKLQRFRAESKLYRGDSFATICGFGANGAIVHYRAEAKSAHRLAKNNLLLLDSGAQYLDGTTDITRTFALGKPTTEQRDRFTRVLKGHIALARAQFPVSTSGSQLDSLARQYLWEAGLDYDHGTGHGVGAYLCVHEGPQRISKIPNRVALLPGMVISNEPGYYKAGAYGIRIENLVMVQNVKGKKGFLEFETLTLAPIDRNLIDAKMLTKAERDWLNAYHARVYRELHKKLDKKEQAWLKKSTAAI